MAKSKLSLERWTSLMDAFSMPENADTYQALIKAYSEKHRAYHTGEHIDACLGHLDTVRGDLDHPEEVELALWFHDAIYKPFSSSNEKDSAIWAQEFFELNGFDDDDVIDRVFDLIMVTEHTGSPKTNDGKLMIDIDLSILGAAPHVYDQFEKDVRFEYKWVPGFLFKKKRQEILSGFLARDRIYQGKIFYDRFEQRARDNLKNAVLNLS